MEPRLKRLDVSRAKIMAPRVPAQFVSAARGCSMRWTAPVRTSKAATGTAPSFS